MGQNSSKRNNNNTPRPQSNQQRPQVRKSAPPQQRQVKNCVPLGLYPECSWDLNILKKHIGNKNLAPIFKGTDQNLTDLEECPICFLFYPGGLNRSNCCKQPLCTECFLQVKKLPTASVCCPFCNTDNYSVVFVGPKTKEEREIEEKEQQMVLEAEERMRREERERDEERERKKKEAAAIKELEAANKKENNEQEDVFSDSYEEGELLKKFLNEEKSDGEDNNNEYLENFYGSGENYDEEYFKNVAKHIESNNQDQLPDPTEDIDDILLMEAIKRSLNTH